MPRSKNKKQGAVEANQSGNAEKIVIQQGKENAEKKAERKENAEKKQGKENAEKKQRKENAEDYLGKVLSKTYLVADPSKRGPMEMVSIGACSANEIPQIPNKFQKRQVREFDLELPTRPLTPPMVARECLAIICELVKKCQEKESRLHEEFGLSGNVLLVPHSVTLCEVLQQVGPKFEGSQAIWDFLGELLGRLLSDVTADENGNIVPSIQVEGVLEKHIAEGDRKSDPSVWIDIFLKDNRQTLLELRRFMRIEQLNGDDACDPLENTFSVAEAIRMIRENTMLLDQPCLERKVVERYKVEPHNMACARGIYMAFQKYQEKDVPPEERNVSETKSQNHGNNSTAAKSSPTMLVPVDTVVIRSGCLVDLVYHCYPKDDKAMDMVTVIQRDKNILYISSRPYFEQDLNSEGWQIQRALCSTIPEEDRCVVPGMRKETDFQKEFYSAREVQTPADCGYRLVLFADIPMRTAKGPATRDSKNNQKVCKKYTNVFRLEDAAKKGGPDPSAERDVSTIGSDMDSSQQGVSLAIKKIVLQNSVRSAREIVQVDREDILADVILPIQVVQNEKVVETSEPQFVEFQQCLNSKLVQTDPSEYIDAGELFRAVQSGDQTCRPDYVQKALHASIKNVVAALLEEEKKELQVGKWDGQVGYSYAVTFNEVGMVKVDARKARFTPLFGKKYMRAMSQDEKDEYKDYLCKHIKSGNNCPFGDKCLYNHDPDDVAKRSAMRKEKGKKSDGKGGKGKKADGKGGKGKKPDGKGGKGKKPDGKGGKGKKPDGKGGKGKKADGKGGKGKKLTGE